MPWCRHLPKRGEGGKAGLPNGQLFLITCGPIINADAIREWKIKDFTARRILLTTIEQKLQNKLVGCKTAFQIWTRLNSQHKKCEANNKDIIQRSQFPKLRIPNG
jgi:hypothetical protein